MAAPSLVWYGDCPAMLRATLVDSGLQLLQCPERDAWAGASACVVACPAANVEALHESFKTLPPLQELSFRIPAGRLIIWDPHALCPATVRTDTGKTGVPRPATPPSARDPWQLNDYALARWVHLTEFLVRLPAVSACCVFLQGVRLTLFETGRQRDRQTERQTGRQTGRQAQTQRYA